MCGIIGGWGINKTPADVQVSLEALIHRGPDDSGIFQSGPVFLGNRRLSIIDLSGGHQPVFNEGQSVATVLNGEIYNYVELVELLESVGHVFRTRSDTECLVHLWEEYGTDMCRMLRGMFAFAIWDSRSNTLFMARDRFGKKPLFYCEPSKGSLLFASELKALRVLCENSGFSFSISDLAVYDYLSFGVVQQPQTIFDNVFALPPAHWMVMDKKGVRIERYWQLFYEQWGDISYLETLEKIRELTNSAVSLRLRSDVPLGVFLSGGIDSSIVAYEARRSSSGELQSFTVAMDDPDLDESKQAGLISRYLGLVRTTLPFRFEPESDLVRLVSHFDQPFFDSSAMPTLKIAALAGKYVKVVLTGDGGDEIFAGYRRHLAAVWLEWFSFMSCSKDGLLKKCLSRFGSQRRSFTGFMARFARLLSTTGGERYLTMTTDMLTEKDKVKIWQGNGQRPTEEWIEQIELQASDEFYRQIDADININLLSDLLVKMDMSTMANSLEARSPLLDHKLAEFVATVPRKFLCDGLRTKGLLRDAYRGLLPKEIIDGKKKGFEVPLGRFLKNELRPMLMDTLAQPDSMVGSYLSRDFLNALINGREMEERNKPYLLYALLVLELWLREFRNQKNAVPV